MLTEKTFDVFAARVGIEPGVEQQRRHRPNRTYLSFRRVRHIPTPLRWAVDKARVQGAAKMRLAVHPRDIGILPAYAHDWITLVLRMARLLLSQLRILLPLKMARPRPQS